MPSVLSRRAALAGIAASLAPRIAAAAAAEQPMSVTSDRRRLYGTLALPEGSGPHPAVLIVAGSGPTDRDGNNPLGIRSDTYKELAYALAAGGVASLRYDKRYVGASNVPPVDETRLRYEDEVDDAVAWLRLLRRDSRLGPLTIAGHSQGSLTGMLAAERVAPAAFVSLEGPSRDGGTILLDQIAARFPADVTATAREIVARLEDGETSVDVPAALQTLFRPSVQPYLMSWFAYDPAREIAQLRCSVTIVAGTADTQVPLADARELQAAAPAARLVVVEGMTHTLKVIGPGVEQFRAYVDPAVPIAPAVVDAVAAAANGAR